MQNQVLTLANGETISYLLEHRQRRTVGLKSRRMAWWYMRQSAFLLFS